MKQKWLHVCVFAFFLVIAAVWGAWRISRPLPDSKPVRISLIQSNMDQAHWGDGSLDTCLDITGTMIHEASIEKPDLIVLAESALFCYLLRRPWVKRKVENWSESIKIPIIAGSLHWDRKPSGAGKSEYSVYNTAFLIDTGEQKFEPYFKIRLLPFSEVMPFEAQIPLLNRVNLGEADFSRGTEETVFHIGEHIKAAPFICFEIVFPGFVRSRVRKGANLLVNITNDGWWGRSNGPFHHAAMTRMRCIENGVPLLRCANSGISMFVDQYGRVQKKTALYKRTVCSGRLPLGTIPTPYTRFGDWPLYIFLFIVCEALFYSIARGWMKRRRKNREKK
jgi:apolipoprotein N-acyltransferase